MNIHSQKYDTFRQESLHSKCKHQKHILLQNNGSLYYILQSRIYKKSSPQFVLRVRDIFIQSYAFKLIKQTNYVQTNYLTSA